MSDLARESRHHVMTTTTELITPGSVSGPYLAALRAGDLHADPAYQREPDTTRVEMMGAGYDRTRLGVLDVSARADGRYAIIDGQHRWAVAQRVRGAEEYLVCRIHTGLSIAEEARLRAEIDTGRRIPTWWDRWRARRRAGDPSVLGIDGVLTRHRLQVNPAPEDGNIRATKTLERIVENLGGLESLDQVVIVLTCAFGHSLDAFDGTIMHGVALVLTRYDPAELDTDRLVAQLRGIKPRHLRARAISLRECHRGTVARLCAAVIVERYNAGRGHNLQPYLSRVPAISTVGPVAHRDRAHRTASCGRVGRNRVGTAQAGRAAAPSVRCTHQHAHAARPPSSARRPNARPMQGDLPRRAVDTHQDRAQIEVVDEAEDSPEVGVPDRAGVRRALANGRGLRWVMDTYGLDYPTAKALRAEFAAA